MVAVTRTCTCAYLTLGCADGRNAKQIHHHLNVGGVIEFESLDLCDR